jgi:hypothetical protein
MQKRSLGMSGLQVSAIGFDCTGMNFSYGHALSNAEGATLIRRRSSGARRLWSAEAPGRHSGGQNVLC